MPFSTKQLYLTIPSKWLIISTLGRKNENGPFLAYIFDVDANTLQGYLHTGCDIKIHDLVLK